MIRLLLRASCLAIVLHSSLSLAEDMFEERAWDILSKHSPSPWSLNPAALSKLPSKIAISQGMGTDQIKFVQNPDAANASDVSSERSRRDLSFASTTTLSGGALTLAIGDHYEKIESKRGNMRNSYDESFRDRDYKLNFGLELLPGLQSGFGFRYLATEQSILGSFNISADERTDGRANAMGYTFGLRGEAFGGLWGLFSQAPLRGLATIAGERKITTRSGLYGAEIGRDVSDRARLGLGVVRWSYKRDDRDEIARSPLNDRAMFGRGLGLDEYFRKTRAYTLNGEYQILENLNGRWASTYQEGVFLLDAMRLPDEVSKDGKLHYLRHRLALHFHTGQFYFELIANQFEHKVGRQKAGLAQLGLQEFGDYVVKRSSQELSIGLLL